MKNRLASFLCVLAVIALIPFTGCAKKKSAEAHDHDHGSHSHGHEHVPPHGGTPIVLGDELYHVELVRDAITGTLQAYVFDGELENFIRIAQPSVAITAKINGADTPLVFAAVANAATGETVGDTSLFQTQADWVKTTDRFEAVLKTITIKGRTFTDVAFKFPEGNETH